jgi:hypothetical protein
VPARPVGLIGREPLCVGGHQHAAVQDVDQPGGCHDLDGSSPYVGPTR